MRAEEKVRDYLRADDGVMGLLNGDQRRCNLEWSGDTRATRVTINRAGGGQNPYFPHEYPVLDVHCYGSTRPAAADLSDAVAVALRALSASNAPLLSASVESISYLPTTDGVARYVVVTSVTAAIPATVA